ncbi:MAG: bifunctional DNA primase/polymerase [Candidatus Hydrogenedentes bacterium]|nr:bifunctional DNA primase/polymerase [Candidatus Hydrogenedentota bacterium]
MTWTLIPVNEKGIPPTGWNDRNDWTIDGNRAVHLGKSGLVDVDLDWKSARDLADKFLPATTVKSGRASNPLSHFWYKASGAYKKFSSKEFTQQGAHKKDILELRAGAHYTIIPPSIRHNEIVEWTGNPDEIPEVAYDEIYTGCSRLAAAALLSEYWQDGIRNDLAMTFAAMAAQNNWTEEETKYFIATIAQYKNDSQDHSKAIGATFKDYADGKPLAGFNKFKEHLGKDADAISAFLSMTFGAVGAVRRIPLTDEQMADHFVSAEKDVLYEGGWVVFDGKRWKRDIDNAAVHMKMYHCIRQFNRENKTHCFKETVAGVESALFAARKRPAIIREIKDFDQHAYFVNFLNGTVDLRTGKLQPHDREDYLTKMIPHNYVENADCPYFDQGLLNIWGDAQMSDFVFRALGYSMIGGNPQKLNFMCYSHAPDAGKTALISTVGRILGTDYYTNVSFRAVSTKGSGNIDHYLAELEGKHFGYVAEPGTGEKLDQERVKALSGNEEITSDRKGERARTWRSLIALWFSTNTLPNVNNPDDEAFFSRWYVLDFGQGLGKKKDTLFVEKCMKEAEGILSKMVAGAVTAINKGLNPPRSVELATLQYKESKDSVTMFLNDCTVPRGKVSKGALYESYVKYCEEEGFEPVSQKMLGAKLLGRLGVKETKPYDSSLKKQVRTFEGVSLGDPADDMFVEPKVLPFLLSPARPAELAA